MSALDPTMGNLRGEAQESTPNQGVPPSRSNGQKELAAASSIRSLMSLMSISSSRGKLPRSKSSRSIKTSNMKKAKLQLKRDRRGGRNKPIVVPHSSTSDLSPDYVTEREGDGLRTTDESVDEEAA